MNKLAAEPQARTTHTISDAASLIATLRATMHALLSFASVELPHRQDDLGRVRLAGDRALARYERSGMSADEVRQQAIHFIDGFRLAGIVCEAGADWAMIRLGLIEGRSLWHEVKADTFWPGEDIPASKRRR